MSKWPMRGHFRYLRLKTFPMTPKTPQCKVFWALMSSPKHSGVPEDSKSPTLEVLGFTPTLGQSGVATRNAHAYYLAHQVRDTMPSSTKMSDNGSTFLGSPMLGEAQFCVPKNNRHQITRKTFTSELKKKKNLELDETVTSKTTRGYH